MQTSCLLLLLPFRRLKEASSSSSSADHLQFLDHVSLRCRRSSRPVPGDGLDRRHPQSPALGTKHNASFAGRPGRIPIAFLLLDTAAPARRPKMAVTVTFQGPLAPGGVQEALCHRPWGRSRKDSPAVALGLVQRHGQAAGLRVNPAARGGPAVPPQPLPSLGPDDWTRAGHQT